MKPENAVVSQDGALTTTLVGVLAEREIGVTPLEATAFALGIHEDTGSLTYPTATQRDADALAWCLRHGARQDLLARFLHTPLTDEERELLAALMAAVRTERVAGVDVLVAAVSWPRHVDGVSNLAHKIVDLTDCRSLVLLVEMDERVFAVTRSRTPEIDAAAIAASLGGGATARRPRRSSAARSTRPRRRFARASRPQPASRCAPSRSCRGRRGRSARTRPSPTRWSSASATPRAESSSSRTAGSSAPSAGRIWTRRSPTASRTRRSRES